MLVLWEIEAFVIPFQNTGGGKTHFTFSDMVLCFETKT